MVRQSCAYCGNKFYTWPSRFSSDRGKYCSVSCRGMARRAVPVKRECLYCGKEFGIIPRLLRNSKGWYCSHPCFLNSLRGKEKIPFIERLTSLIKFPKNENDCAVWTGSPDQQGYGKIGRIVNGHKLTLRPHRVVYELYFGPVDSSIGILHICDNPLCCNILHLFAGSQLDNMRDKVTKDRQAKGEKNGRSKLTNLEVAKIKYLLNNGEMQKIIARKFNVSEYTISAIKSEKMWKHIPNPANN